MTSAAISAESEAGLSIDSRMRIIFSLSAGILSVLWTNAFASLAEMSLDFVWVNVGGKFKASNEVCPLAVSASFRCLRCSCFFKRSSKG